jgi:hypothetical protein
VARVLDNDGPNEQVESLGTVNLIVELLVAHLAETVEEYGLSQCIALRRSCSRDRMNLR